jgi:hypothetical protein
MGFYRNDSDTNSTFTASKYKSEITELEVVNQDQNMSINTHQVVGVKINPFSKIVKVNGYITLNINRPTN